MAAPTTLLLVHNLPHVIMMWRAVLGPHCGRYYICGEAVTTEQTLCAAATLKPAVVLLDAGMAGLCIAAVVQQLRACAVHARLLICWQCRHHHLVEQLPGQPMAYLVEDAHPSEMLLALSQLMLGNMYYCGQTERLWRPHTARNRLPVKHRQLLIISGICRKTALLYLIGVIPATVLFIYLQMKKCRGIF